jgi:hypothetical protein
MVPLTLRDENWVVLVMKIQIESLGGRLLLFFVNSAFLWKAKRLAHSAMSSIISNLFFLNLHQNVGVTHFHVTRES